MSTIDNPQALSEVARRGDEIYEQDLKASLEATDIERLEAIDVTNRKFALGDSVLMASDSLQKETGADPENIWIVRIGSEAVYRFSSPRSRYISTAEHDDVAGGMPILAGPVERAKTTAPVCGLTGQLTQAARR